MEWKKLEAKVIKRMGEIDPSDLMDAINETLDNMSNKLNIRENKEVYSSQELEIAVTADNTTVFDGSSKSFIDETITFYKKLSGESTYTLVSSDDYTVSSGVVTMTTGNLDNGDTAKIVGTGSSWATYDYSNKLTFPATFKELFNVYVNDVLWTMKAYDVVKEYTAYDYYCVLSRDELLFTDQVESDVTGSTSSIRVDANWNFERVIVYLQEIDIPQVMEDCFIAGVISELLLLPGYHDEDKRKYYSGKFQARLNEIKNSEEYKFEVADIDATYDYR